MQAILLCAGKSTRTYPLTITKPKPLLKVANITLIEHNLEQLQNLVKDVIIVVGFKKDMIEKIGNKFGKLKITYVEQKSQLGTGHAILSVKSHIKNKFIVLNGDDIYSKKDIKNCLKHDYCILVKEVNDLSRFGEVIIKNDSVTEIKEKPKGKKKGLANTGLYVFDKNIFSYKVQKSVRGEYEIVDYIKHLVKDGKKVSYEKVKNYCFAITYPWNLLEANEFFLSKIKTKIPGKVEKGAALKGQVIVGKNTLIKSGSYIEGPVVIGENCVIGPNCYIRSGSAIGNNSKVGNAVEVKNSIIGDNTHIGHLSYIGDSILGDNVNLGAGTISANLRHDNANIKSHVKKELVNTGRRKLGAIIGDNVHTGIHTSIYPGRKIWPDKTTLPGEIVKKDIGGW